MNETQLFEWLRAERADHSMPVEVPKDLETELVQLFKTCDKSSLPNLARVYNEIYRLRETKIIIMARHWEEGLPVLLSNMTEREKDLSNKIIDVLEEGRKAIFPFLALPHRPRLNDCKPEFENVK